MTPCCTEERSLRAEFQAEHGQYIPDDFCLYVENPPNRWVVSTWNSEPVESMPAVENDILEEVSTLPGILGDELLNGHVIGASTYFWSRC